MAKAHGQVRRINKDATRLSKQLLSTPQDSPQYNWIAQQLDVLRVYAAKAGCR